MFHSIFWSVFGASFSVLVVVLLLEKYYRDYLFACRRLKLDPTRIYGRVVVDNRVMVGLLNATTKKELRKLKWFQKYYHKMEGGIFGNKLVTRARKQVAKGKLVLDYDISEP